MTQITSQKITNTGVYLTLVLNKTEACVSKTDHEVRVLKKNASHAAWRGSGRGFDSFAEAIEAYKSADMKEILRVAQEVTQGANAS